MISREASDRLAFYASVVVHGVLLMVLLREEAAQRIYLPPLPMNQAGRESGGIFLTDGLKKQELERAEALRWTRFGDPEGGGTAINMATGENLLSGHQGEQDQAWLSRDPIGPGPLPEEPSFSTVLPGDGGSGGLGGGVSGSRTTALPDATKAPAPFGVGGSFAALQVQPRIAVKPPPALVGVIPPPAVEPIGVGPASQPIELVAPTTQESKPLAVVAVPKPGKGEAAPAPNRSVASSASREPSGAQRKPSASQAGNGGAGGGRPGPPVPAADPAPMSDSESDPFSRVGSVTIRAGRIEAQLGRAHKLIKPRLTIKGLLDLQSIVNPRVIMKVSLSEKGKVTNVEILRSSGSNEIDLPTTLAMYKSWIEPRKDKNGKPMADIVVIVFNFR